MKIIGPFTQIIPLSNISLKGKLSDSELNIIPNGGVLVDKDKIIEVNNFEKLTKKFPKYSMENIDNNQVLLPNFIDCHTHICFAGSRAHDFVLRNAGISYLEIAKQGGGIWSTVTQTREATLDELTQNVVDKVNNHIRNGITTIEVKSGYGLNKASELKMLEAIYNSRLKAKADIVSTCLAAHIKPKDFEGNNQAYLEYIISEILPEAKKNTERVDIFIEESAFNKKESKNFLLQAKSLGFASTVHADQFTTGGSLIAVEVGALSADHLEASTDKEIKILAQSNTVAVALPGASIGLGEPFTPARKLLDLGACLAIASDWNPGSAPQGDLLMQASVLATYEKLSTAEVLSGLTFRAAKALQLFDRGVIEENKIADFHSYNTNDFREIVYHQGTMKPNLVWKNGEIIFCKS